MKDYPQVSLRLPPEVRDKLEALSLVASTPQWRLIIEAIDCLLRERSESQRTSVDAVVAGGLRRSARRKAR